MPRFWKGSARRVVTVATVVIVTAVVVLSAAAQSNAPKGRLVALDSAPPPISRTLGCGDVPMLNGAVDPDKNFLCGTAGNDVIRAGSNDVVRSGGGNDKIYASNSGPNDIDGGPGYNRAWVDRWDTYRAIQIRRLSALRPNGSAEKTPNGFDFSPPTVICDLDAKTDQQVIRVDLPTGRQIMMAAFNANPGVVDWQYVAWQEVINRYDRSSGWQVYKQLDWLWDRTYDLGEFKKHTPNEWHSFVAGQDDQEADLEPFVITEPGDYSVWFRLYWYAESAATSSAGVLRSLPGESTGTWPDYQGRFVPEAKSTQTGQRFYCRFP